MPSKTRSARATKASKENISVVRTTKASKVTGKALKARKPLADKTNSASDDNASLSEKLTNPVGSVTNKKIKDVCEDYTARPRRARCLPTRYKDNSTLVNLSNSLISSPTKVESPGFQISEPLTKSKVGNKPVTQNPACKATVLAKKKTSPVKKVNLLTLTKSPVKTLDCSLVNNRPKRICRLPTKYEDHSVSPNKYVPLQPINASTPLATKTKKINKENGEDSLNVSPVLHKKAPRQRALKNNEIQKIIADPNNNAKKNKDKKSPNTSVSTPDKIFKARASEKATNKNTSIRLLDDKNRRKRDSSKLDVYEFTFDPDEEPRPAKKKKKQAPRKPKPKTGKTKPQTVTIKTNYDKNLAKALAALKNVVSSKSNTDTVKQNQEVATTVKENVKNVVNNLITKSPVHINNFSSVADHSEAAEKNYNSVRVEDIARDFQIMEDDHSFDYSPVNSPCRPKTPVNENNCNTNKDQSNIADPLNLREDVSFFDEVPVACSSMNVSVRHPQASPWRAEFGSLPIKWQVNTYVKSNMTPAFESSFINFNDDNSKKKHVYTNMVPEVNDPLPQVDNTSNLKQTSIISFIKEVVERNANKKNKKSTPVKTNSLFEDLRSTSIVHKTPNKETPLKDNDVQITPHSNEYQNNASDVSSEKEPSTNKENSIETIKTPNGNKNANRNNTYFGFDDTEDQENVLPIKINSKAKSLRSRTRGILQEINTLKGPTRAISPVAAKSKPRYRNEIKHATEPPVFPQVAVSKNNTNTQESCLPDNLTNTDDQSVHLFEDLDLLEIHHPKPSRKSYGKAKKVAFVQKRGLSSDDSSISDAEPQTDRAAVSSDEDNLDDLSFKLPSEKPKRTNKKKKPKKQLSKKEEKEVEAWAAGFNSMCEDIDGFDLVVE
ncbi:uncharacterized protein LOC112058363 [Bicyclus anynana]|uniref:Uncharacterized protein LOC112058363 n=1 Tax=Bicyclus anynana TaxID=110368 RepID=A0A6J1PAL7_BICAN|nr:uncharacterized protein LOC112058363 [Bicyclus anynana]